MTTDKQESFNANAVDTALEEWESQNQEETTTLGHEQTGFLTSLLRVREVSVLGATIILFVLLAWATPLFLKLDNLLLVARQISILAVMATGMTFLFISREIDLSVGSIYGFLAVCLAFLITKAGLNPWLAVLLVVLFGAVLGSVNGLITTKFNIPSFIVTLGALSILRGGALLLSGGWPILIKLPEGNSFQFLLAGYLGKVVPMQIFWMIGVMLIAGFVLSRTRFGAHVYATGGNEESAILNGIATKRVKIINFATTGALCGIAGAMLLGQVRSGFPLTGQGFELDVIAAVVIGGTPLFGGAGSILGTLLGAAIIGMITNGLVLLGASAYIEPVAKGSIIVIAVLVDTLIRRKRS